MKKVYSIRHLMAFLLFFCCCSASLLAQVTQPSAQPLPYSQDFSNLLLVYPAGIQGGLLATSAGSAYLLTDNTLDKALVNGTSASTTGAAYNYDQKIGFLNSNTANIGICLALNTLGKYGIEIKYDAMTIRNPGTKTSELILQYRIGTTAPFITLSETAYQNITTVQNPTPGITTPQNPITIKTVLPAACNNQPVVQVRWVSKDVSGTGSRPSFAIDNIGVQNDITAPINVTGYPKFNNVLSNGFDFSTQLNEIGKTYYVLLAGGSSKPSIAQIKSGLDANGNPALQADVLNNADASLAYTKSLTGLTLNTNYTVYSIAEDAYGNIQLDSNRLDVTTANVLTPSITPSINSLALGLTEQNFISNSFSYQVQATNLNSSVTLTTTGNFTISKDANANFQTSVTFDKTDFDANNTPTVYVRFTPNGTGDFTGTIIHQSTGAADKTIALSGTGINPYIQNFNDTNVLSNSGWTAYSVAGNIIKWVSTSSRFNSSPAAVQINGYTEAGASKDWLISPRLRLDNFSNFPVLSFYSRKYYAGSALKLMVSVNYDGVSSPETATWTALEGDFPTTTGVFKQSNNINLSAYKTDHTYLAWVYETVTNDSDSAAEWTIDDVSITNGTSFLASNPILNFGEANVNAVSDSQSFIFAAGGYGNFTLTAPTDYQLSVDNISFQSSIVVPEADALSGKTIYARFAPSAKALTVSGSVTVTAAGLNQQIGLFTASSWPKTETFDIVTYNLEFFGSNVTDTSGKEFGPVDDVVQVENVAKVMNKLNADVYVVQEVSDEPSLTALIQKISINGKTFDKTISPAWSYSFDTPDPNYPPQKLVVLYNTQTVKVKKATVLFSDLYDNIRAGNTSLPNYPGGNSNSFFASGRLPYMVEIETNIGGIKKDINVIDLHARANSGTDVSKYNMRKYDVEYLKSYLDANYPDANFMILGDFNDDVKTSVVQGQTVSSYDAFVSDTARYNPLTLGISNAGASSFLSSGGFLDHIIVSNELTDEYLPSSIAVYDPRNDIANYVNSTSDHGPVIARFDLKSDTTLSVLAHDLNAEFTVKTYPVPAVNTVNLSFKTDSSRNLNLKLYNSNGQLVIQSEIKEPAGEYAFPLSISQLQPGIYFYTLSENNKVVYRSKIIKK